QQPQQPELLKLKIGESIQLETNEGLATFKKFKEGIFILKNKNGEYNCTLTTNKDNPVIAVRQTGGKSFQNGPVLGACLKVK
ncbi:MAG: hypothetical protein ACKO96_03325, partial [Flammeovirgaceae bacterium]